MNRREIEWLRDEGWRERTPFGERLDVALKSDRLPNTDGSLPGPHSPLARFHPDISAALDIAIRVPTSIPDPDWLRRNGFTFEHSNLPERRVQPEQFGCGDESCDCEPKSQPQGSVIRLDHRDRKADYRAGLAVASVGIAVRTVVLHDPNAPTYSPKPISLTKLGGNWTPTLVAFPLPYGWSTERVARFVMDQFASKCYWTGKRTKVQFPQSPNANCSRNPDVGMLVSSGGSGRTHVFPTCDVCRWQLSKDIERNGWINGGGSVPGLDYVVNDGWVRRTGLAEDKDI
jgi:hypothetical protein